jgi:multidrug efflux pump subunit AcrB
MWYLPVTVILAIFTSLFVAMVINPALSAIFIRLPFGHGAVKIKRTPEEIQEAMELTLSSESIQWWFSLASAVSFGLAFSTMLTLIVVPVLYSLNQSGTLAFSRARKWLHSRYWNPFYKLTGIKPREEEE